MVMIIRRVRAAAAAAITMGEGRYPSVDAWCSMKVADTNPTRSPPFALLEGCGIQLGGRCAELRGAHVVAEGQ